MGGGSKNVADYLELVWNNLAITYPNNITHMKYKDFAMVLPFQTMCSSMAVSDKSALSAHFKHNAGLTLKQMEDLTEWLQSFYTVRFRHYRLQRQCTEVQRLVLLKKVADFVVRMRFFTEAKFSPKDLAPFYFMHKGRLLSAAKWLPMVAKHRHYLLSKESNSPYWEYLNQGYTSFNTSRRGCIVEFRDATYVKKMFEENPQYYALDIRRKIKNQEIPLPPYHLVKDLDDKQWTTLFGTDFTSVKEAIEERKRREYALSPTENMRLGLLVSNGWNIRDEDYSIQELLIKLAEGTYKEDIENELDEYNRNLDRHRRATRVATVIHNMTKNSFNETRDPLKHLQDVLLEKIYEETGMNVTEEELQGWIQDSEDNPVRRTLAPFGLSTNDTMQKPLLRKKRFVSQVVSLTMRIVPQMQKIFGLLYKAARHWFNKIVGNPLTTRTLAIAHKTVAKADAAGRVVKKKVATFVTRARNSRQKRALMERFGPYATASLKYTKDAGNKMSMPLKAVFTPTRAGHLRLPSTLPTRFQDLNGNKAVMHLRNRLFRGWQYAKNHKMGVTFNIAGMALLGYGISDIVAAGSRDAEKIDFCEGSHLDNYTCSEDTLSTRPLLRAAVSNYNGILRPAFLYNIDRHSNVSIADQLAHLQREVLGQLGQVNVTEDVKDIVQTSLDVLEDAYRSGNVVNIFDQEIDLRERQRHLKATRNSNAVSRYHSSYEFAHMLYAQKSNLHKRALEAFELFIGLQSYSHRTLQADEKFQDELVRNYCLGSIGKEEFVTEIDGYFFLVYKQLKEQFDKYVKRGYDVGAPSSMDGLEGTSPQLDLIGLGSHDHHIFRALTVKRGQDELNDQDKDMDLILALDEERRYWNDNYQTHRLLIKTLAFDMPPDPVTSDYIHSMMWYQIYLARPNIRKHVEYFMTKTAKLLLIRLYMENRAVNMSTVALEQEMDEVDLEQLREDPQVFVINATSLRETLDNTEYYDILRDPEQVITDFSATAEQLAESPEIIRKAFGSQVNETYDNTTADQILRRVKRSATHIFETLTNTTLYQQDVARMISDEDHLDLIVARHRLHLEQGNLSMHNLMLLQEEVKKIRHIQDEEGTAADVKKAHQLYLINVIKYLSKEEYPDLGILAMLLTPEQIERVKAERRDIGERLLSVQLRGQLPPLGDLQQKNAILAFMQQQQDVRRDKELQDKVRKSMEDIDRNRRDLRKYVEDAEEVLANAENGYCGTSGPSKRHREKYWDISLIVQTDCWKNAPTYQVKLALIILSAAGGILVAFSLLVGIMLGLVQTIIENIPPFTKENIQGNNEEENAARQQPLLNPEDD